MKYPALIDFDGDHIVADFPDCPGCQAMAEPEQDIVAAATPAIERWLEACLVEGTLPPKPSAAVVTRDWFEWVPISPELSRKLLLRWAAAKRISRTELARRAGITEETLAHLEDQSTHPSAAALDGVSRALGVVGHSHRVEPALEPESKPEPAKPARAGASRAARKTVKKKTAARRR